MVLWGFLLVVATFFLIPLIGGFILYAILRMIKKENVSLYACMAGVLLLIALLLNGHAYSYLAIVAEIKLPFISALIQKLTKEKMNVFSILGVLSFTLIFNYILHLLVKYKLKMPMKSKQDGIKKKKESSFYQSFRKKTRGIFNHTTIKVQKK